MKKVVKHKTAIELKQAGFPQPKPAFGQIWYDSDGTPCVVFTETGDFVTNDGTVFSPLSTDNLYFAPDATEILNNIPLKSLTFFPGDGIDDPWWQVEFFDEIKPTGNMLAEHANPAEACAATWLSLIKK